MSFRPTVMLLAKPPRAPVMGRATRGLYHGKHILFGNTRAHSERKTRRSWKPNVQSKTFTSELLNQKIRVNVTTKALKCMDKVGGFDNYILRTDKVYFGGENSFGGRLQELMFEVKMMEYFKNAEAARAAATVVPVPEIPAETATESPKVDA